MPLNPSLPPDHDWHLHTVFSDGFAAPEAVVRGAAAHGLRSVAITDHDCLDAHLGGGLARLGASLGLEVVVGAEIDCAFGDTETEVLAYRFDPEHPGLAGRLRAVQDARWERFRFFCAGLTAEGLAVDAAEVVPAGTRVPIKVHLFRWLMARGVYREGQYKAFKARLDALGAPPAVVKPALEEVVALVRAAGGFSVLAHPLYYARPIGLDRLVAAGAAAGCVGVELVYPYRHGPKGIAPQVARAGLAELQAAVARHLPSEPLWTRGSDMHDPAQWGERLVEMAAWEVEG
ncbi:MAG: PHP domain-containing protein [Pseudomonadota bacterium]